jgi:bis(5'-nucleosyl)-tetraphosphatase (symmetrical)
MATWVIGDVHGCWETLQRLLERLGWDPGRDLLWLIGDAVNKGPGSLEVLRWAVREPRVDSLLGNHDLHLLARAAGLAEPRPDDRLGDVLGADDRDELLGWLGRRPLLEQVEGSVLVHAGLMPEWDLDEAASLAVDTAARLAALLPRLAHKPKPKWGRHRVGDERLAAAVGIFTRLRVVRADGRPKLGFIAAPEAAPTGVRPWFETSRVVRDGHAVIFGHWATMGFRRVGRVVCLDSGCVYGGSLTAICLDDQHVIQVPLADRVEV